MTAFVGIIDRPTTITINGYSNMKTINGVMHDVARILKRIEPLEASTFRTKGNAEALEFLQCTPGNGNGYFYMTIEEVPCASCWDEEVEEMKYIEGYHYYFCTRVVKHTK